MLEEFELFQNHENFDVEEKELDSENIYINIYKTVTVKSNLIYISEKYSSISFGENKNIYH